MTAAQRRSLIMQTGQSMEFLMIDCSCYVIAMTKTFSNSKTFKANCIFILVVVAFIFQLDYVTQEYMALMVGESSKTIT